VIVGPAVAPFLRRDWSCNVAQWQGACLVEFNSQQAKTPTESAPVILATQEAEISRISFGSQPST
jgi:hypothetical protein